MWEKRLHPENKSKKNRGNSWEQGKILVLWNKQKNHSWEKKFSESIFRILNKLNKYWGIYKAKIILEGKKEHSGSIEELLKVKNIIRNEKFDREIRR